MSKKRHHRNQHTVPRCYLENFTDSNGSLWMFGPELRTYKNSPKNTLTQKYYYTVKHGKVESLYIEKTFLGTIEAAFARIFREKISRHLPLSVDEHIALSVFIAAQMNRVPNRRKAMVDFINRIEEKANLLTSIFQGEEQTFEDTFMPRADSERAVNLEDMLKFRNNIDSEHSKMMPMIARDIARIIADMRWAFMFYEDSDNAFITSDDPCIMINPDLEADYGPSTRAASPGLYQDGVELTFPLSSKIALLCGWKMTRDGEYTAVNSSVVNDMNKRQMRRASLIVTCSESHSIGLARYIKERQRSYDIRNVLRYPLQPVDLADFI